MIEAIQLPVEAPRLPWGVLASIGLHALALALLVVPVARTIVAPPEQSIAVDLVSADEFERLFATPAAPEATPLPPAEVAPLPEWAPGSSADGFVHATRLQAADILEHDAIFRAQMSNVADSERIVQLCGVEGLDQIRAFDATYDPDMIVAYAMGQTSRQGLTLIADGAAFRSARAWYTLRFRCTVLPDFSAVTDYAFAIGDAVPREEWEAHDLTEDEGMLDQP